MQMQMNLQTVKWAQCDETQFIKPLVLYKCYYYYNNK